ncbi:hypothetical protein A4A49_16523 [Nicotiana attenuata]|uniref:ADP,ATP carrier protein n=1 Tax=Nicotiana attenuata TaxID=49451 RepID=A0A1J6ITM2_NICAT|nr:hypothetical protein A4A49_16523 [Nicotiana attenuata]
MLRILGNIENKLSASSKTIPETSAHRDVVVSLDHNCAPEDISAAEVDSHLYNGHSSPADDSELLIEMVETEMTRRKIQKAMPASDPTGTSVIAALGETSCDLSVLRDCDGDKENILVSTVNEAKRFYSLLGLRAIVALIIPGRIMTYFYTMRSIWDPGVDRLKIYLFDPCKELAYISWGEAAKVKGKAAIGVVSNPLQDHEGALAPYLTLHNLTTMTLVLLCSNLEDKVLIEDGVMS